MRGGHDQPGRARQRDGTEPLKQGECGNSNTPGGVFEYNRRVEGIRESGLGGMWNPVYFNYGIAIHGAMNVPLAAGVARLHPHPDDALRSTSRRSSTNGDKVYVFDGVKEPELYSGARAADVQLARSRLHDDHDDDHRRRRPRCRPRSPTTAPPTDRRRRPPRPSAAPPRRRTAPPAPAP